VGLLAAELGCGTTPPCPALCGYEQNRGVFQVFTKCYIRATNLSSSATFPTILVIFSFFMQAKCGTPPHPVGKRVAETAAKGGMHCSQSDSSTLPAYSHFFIQLRNYLKINYISQWHSPCRLGLEKSPDCGWSLMVG
jgi:hypothetical protein